MLVAFELPLSIPENLQIYDIIETMKLDKKVIAGSTRLILVKSAGEGIIDSSSDKLQIAAALKACQTKT